MIALLPRPCGSVTRAAFRGMRRTLRARDRATGRRARWGATFRGARTTRGLHVDAFPSRPNRGERASCACSPT